MQEKLKEIFSLNSDTADCGEIKERIIGTESKKRTLRTVAESSL